MTGSILKKARFGMAATACVAVFGGLLSVGAAVIASAPASATPFTGGAYFPLGTPVRIADTRTGSGLPNAGQTLSATATDVIAIPTGDITPTATAVVLNVTATNATALSYFTVFPTGDPTAIQAGNANANFSNLNFFPGISQPNLVTVPIGGAPGSPSVSIYNHSGSVDAVVDLEGYYDTPPGNNGGQFFPLTPSRITDTRAGSGQLNQGKTLGSNGSPSQVLPVQVTGKGGVPASNVAAVELNVTATNTTASSFFTVYPAGPSLPLVSNLNWVTGETVPNRVIVPVSSTGAIDIYNYSGSADVVVDVDGWFSASTYGATDGSYFNPIAQPARISDTRTGTGTPQSGTPLTTGATETVQVSGAGGVPAISPAVSVTAADVNVTEADTTNSGFFTVYPAAGSRPLASDLNFIPGDVIANSDMVGLSSTGAIDLYNFIGTADAVVDVFGYYVPVVAPVVDTVAVTPTSSSFPGDGTTTTLISVHVTRPGSGDVNGDAVTLSVAPSATCGILSNPSSGSVAGNVVSGTTNSSGLLTATYTASIYAQSCVFTATEANTAQSGNGTVVQGIVSGYQIALAANPTSVPHGTTNGSTLTATVSDNGFSPPGTETITFSDSGPANVCGSLGSPTATTNPSGIATSTFTSGSATGTCTVKATDAARASINAQAPITVS